ncbi:MAG: alanine racemase [Williamsia herbipolensis]|nr:alanine racemase [Williamsia herbipolensis]
MTAAAHPSAAPDALAQTDWSAVPTPALTVDVRRLETNIAEAATTFGEAGIILRPHFKTSKCLEVASRQRAAGAVGFTCSTPAEVEALSAAGFTDLLWAHQPVGPGKVGTAVSFARSHGLTLIADSVAVAEPIARQAGSGGEPIRYLLDVDTGQGRTGVDPRHAVATAEAIAALGGLGLAGVVTHEGHLSAHGADRDALDAAGAGVGVLLAQVAQALREAGFDCPVVSVGSTPGMRTAPFAPGVTEARPGTYVYFDANQVRLGSAGWQQCASSVLTRVVSVNRPGNAIVDAGLKAMSSDAISPVAGVGTVVDPSGDPLPGLEFRTANEEHGFLSGDTAALRVGDLLRIIPNHACGTSNMWSRLLAVHPDGATEDWAIVARH